MFFNNFVKKVNNIKYYISNVSDWNLWLHIWDNEDKVISNRKKIASKLWFNLEDFVYMNQVHGSEVEIIFNPSLNSFLWKRKEAAEKNKLDKLLNCDTLVTKDKWIVLSVMVADCVPVILYDDINKVVWVSHCWWKSTNLKILKKTISEMLSIWADINNVKIIIWPSISSCSYEVWEEVWINFREEVKTEIINNKQYLNLKLENKIQALESWVKESNIEIIDIDTFTDENYFSARRDWYNKWRFAAFLWIK